MATRLAELGSKVAICSRKKEVVEATANEIHSKTKQQVVAYQVDVREAEDISRMMEGMVKDFGVLPDCVVNNAAGNFVAPFERLSPNAWKTIIDIVLNGTANVTMEVGKRWIKSKRGGSFVNISTTYAETGSAFVVPSAAAKAGVDALTKSLSVEWNRHGIRLNSIALGPIETKGAFSRLLPHVYQGSKTKEMKGEWMADVRLGEAEELANLVSYLLSDYSSWTTGAVILFDGGATRMDAGMFNRLLKLSEGEWDMVEKLVRKTKGS